MGNDWLIVGNGCFIVGNDENGGAYIGKCSTQVGNYINGGAYIGK